MKLTIIIPTYWGRTTPYVWKEGDTVYSHPIPLNSNAENLQKTIQSFNRVKNKNFNLLVVAAATTPAIEAEMESKLRAILNQQQTDFPLYLFTHSHLKKLLDACSELKNQCKDFISLNGYSNIKNAGLMAGNVMDAEYIAFVDDDEYVTDPDFVDKILTHIGQEHHGKPVFGLSGYYQYDNNSYKLERRTLPWMTYWNRIKWMNKTFDQIIGTAPRLKETPFVFGGCMILHKKLFGTIPFDPNVNRGEEFDYLLSSLMFGFPFYLDNELYIRHDPPPASYPDWMHMREDIHTFTYLLAKLRSQEDRPNMRRLYAEDFDPYPGYFMQKKLFDLVYKSNMMLSNSYQIEGDPTSAGECLRNIQIAEEEAYPKFNPFRKMLENKEKWERIMGMVDNNKTALKQFIEKIEPAENGHD